MKTLKPIKNTEKQIKQKCFFFDLNLEFKTKIDQIWAKRARKYKSYNEPDNIIFSDDFYSMIEKHSLELENKFTEEEGEI